MINNDLQKYVNQNKHLKYLYHDTIKKIKSQGLYKQRNICSLQTEKYFFTNREIFVLYKQRNICKNTNIEAKGAYI